MSSSDEFDTVISNIFLKNDDDVSIISSDSEDDSMVDIFQIISDSDVDDDADDHQVNLNLLETRTDTEQRSLTIWRPWTDDDEETVQRRCATTGKLEASKSYKLD